MAHSTILLMMSDTPPLTIEETILASSETHTSSMPSGMCSLRSSKHSLISFTTLTVFASDFLTIFINTPGLPFRVALCLTSSTLMKTLPRSLRQILCPLLFATSRLAISSAVSYSASNLTENSIPFSLTRPEGRLRISSCSFCTNCPVVRFASASFSRSISTCTSRSLPPTSVTSDTPPSAANWSPSSLSA